MKCHNFAKLFKPTGRPCQYFLVVFFEKLVKHKQALTKGTKELVVEETDDEVADTEDEVHTYRPIVMIIRGVPRILPGGCTFLAHLPPPP